MVEVTQQIPRFVPRESVRTSPRAVDERDYGAYLNALCDQIDREDETAEYLRQIRFFTNLRHVEGRQLGYLDRQSGVWVDAIRQDGDPIYVSNVIAYFVNALLTEDARSEVVLDVMSLQSRLEAVGAARLAGEMLQGIRRNTWKATEKQRESKFTIITGNSFRRTRLAQSRHISLPVPKFSEKQVRMGGLSFGCTNPECLYVGDTAEMGGPDGQLCPRCKAPNPTVHGEMVIPVMMLDGFGEEPAVELRTDVIDPFQIKLPLAARSLEDAAWMRWSVMAYQRQLEVQFPWAEIGTGRGGQAPQNTGLAMLREMERSPGNVATRIDLQTSESQFDGLTEFKTYYLEPWYYAERIEPKDEILADGSVLKAGTRLIEQFPQGMMIHRVGRTIVSIEQERKTDYWSQRRWDLMPDNIWGRGIEDMIQSQQQRNEIKSLLYECLLNHAAPRTFYNPLKYRRSDLQSRPNWAAPIKNANLSDNPANYIHVMESRAGGSELVGFLEETKRDQQLEGGGAFTPNPGMPDSNNPTARGKLIMRDAAVAMLTPKLQLKAELDIETAQQYLRACQQFELFDYYANRISDYAEFELATLKKLNVDRDLVISGRAGSEMPISEDDRRNDLDLALTMGGLPGGIFNPEMPLEVRKLALERLNLPLETDKINPHKRKQRIEIHKLLMWAQEAERAGLDIEMAAMVALQGFGEAPEPLAPVRIYDDEHEIHLQEITEFLNTDEGLKASPLVLRLLEDHRQQHIQGGVMRTQQMNMLAIAGQAPMIDAQMAIQSTQAEQQASAGPPDKTAGPPAGKKAQGQPPARGMAQSANGGGMPSLAQGRNAAAR